MAGDVGSARRRPPRTRGVPLLVLLLSLAATFVVATILKRGLDERDRLRFESEAMHLEREIHERMQIYLAILRGIAGLMKSQPEIDHDEFRGYVARLRIDERYRGVLGLGWSVRMTPANTDEILASGREVTPGFDIWPAPVPPEGQVVLFLEPPSPHNQNVLGFDMASEPTRREAMARARDDGYAALSGKLTMLPESDVDQPPGFGLYVPVYRHGDPPATVAERRTELTGFAFAPFRARDLFGEALAPSRTGIEIEVYDGPRPEPAALLYRSSDAVADDDAIVQRMTIAGRTWTLRFFTTGHFVGGTTWIPVTAAAIGVIVSVLFFGLTRREVAARAAERTARLTAEDEAVLRERLLAVVSHDLRNPLGTIVMSAELLRAEGASAATVKSAERIERSATRMGRLIGQLLDLARLREGLDVALERAPVDLRGLAEDLLDEFRSSAPRHRFALRAVGDTTANVDELRVTEVLSNLVGNAIQHGAPDLIEVELEGRPGEVVLTVHNAGPPIPPEVQRTMFTPFRRGTTAGGTTRSVGLGLYIAREVVRAHGGTIDVRSPDRDGTTFVVTLPR